MKSGIGNTEKEFIEWVLRLGELEPPAELIGFHVGLQGQYLKQIELVDGVVSIVGPNADTQYSAEIQIGAIARMPSGTAQSLVDEGCILTDDVTRAKMIIAAWTRMQQAGFYQPATVAAYFKSCNEIKLTGPTMDTMDALFHHFRTHFGMLQPPTALKGYHASLLRFYGELQRTQDIELVPAEVLQDLNDETLKLTPEIVGLLVTSGCAG